MPSTAQQKMVQTITCRLMDTRARKYNINDAAIEMLNHNKKTPLSVEFLACLSCTLRGVREWYSGQVYGACDIMSCSGARGFFDGGVHSFPCWNFKKCGQSLFFLRKEFRNNEAMTPQIAKCGWHERVPNGYVCCKFCICNK